MRAITRSAAQTPIPALAPAESPLVRTVPEGDAEVAEEKFGFGVGVAPEDVAGDSFVDTLSVSCGDCSELRERDLVVSVVELPVVDEVIDVVKVTCVLVCFTAMPHLTLVED